MPSSEKEIHCIKDMSSHLISRLIRFSKRQLRRLTSKNGIAGQRNKLWIKGRLHQVRFDIQGDDNLIEVEEGAILSNLKIYMRGDHHQLKIGKQVNVGGGSFWFEDEYCTIVLGDYTTVESAHLAVTEPRRRIILGEDCMLATNIEIRTGDSHSITDVNTGKRINPPGDVVLENHVWIGANAVILKNVTIGTNSIVATNSVVTKNIPSSSVSAGQPAQVVKSGVSWLRERINNY